MKERNNGKKRSFISSCGIILIIILGSLNILKPQMVRILVITNQNTHEKYFTTIVNDFDTITYGWIHSFEKTPWVEKYSILEDNSLMLRKIILVGFGAGIPHIKGKVIRLAEGTIIMDEINQQFNEINWIHSQSAVEYIKLNDKTIIKGRDLPHHEPLKLKIEKRLRLCLK